MPRMPDLASFWLRMPQPTDRKTVSLARMRHRIKVAAAIRGYAPLKRRLVRVRRNSVAVRLSASEETRVRGLRSQARLRFLMLREVSRPVPSPLPAGVPGLVPLVSAMSRHLSIHRRLHATGLETAPLLSRHNRTNLLPVPRATPSLPPCVQVPAAKTRRAGFSQEKKPTCCQRRH